MLFLFRCYLRKQAAYIPIMARVTAGYYMEQEPVAVVPVANTQAVREALKAAIGCGNPTIPTPTRANSPPPVMLKYAGVKDWSTFARSAATWKIEQDGACKIIRGKNAVRGSFEDDPDRIITFSKEATIDDVIDRLVTLMQEAALAQQTRNKR